MYQKWLKPRPDSGLDWLIWSNSLDSGPRQVPKQNCGLGLPPFNLCPVYVKTIAQFVVYSIAGGLGLGFGVWGLGLRVYNLQFRLQDLGIRVSG